MSPGRRSARQCIVCPGGGRPWLLLLLLLTAVWLPACQPDLPQSAPAAPRQITLIAAGEEETHATRAANVREFLDEVGLTLNEADEVTPPPHTPLEEGMTVRVVRVTESVEVIPESIPFERRIVRSETMEADDPPRLLQAGKPGLQEVTIRIVYRDGLEAERWPTQVQQVEPAQDEIVMVGIGAARDDVTFAGRLAYVSDGAALLLRGSTLFPQQLETGGLLDGRVFQLSPDGDYLLYTRTTSDATRFHNSLWVLSVDPGATPRPLGAQNVLWAGWNPDRTDLLQIAYTTAISTSLPPGWEANNDLWLGDLRQSETAPFQPEQIVESYPATFGWWGGNYAWSPAGRFIAYSYADEVGLIDAEAAEDAEGRRVLYEFTEYNTLSDWVWVPTLSWSSDGRYLAFPAHAGADPEEAAFEARAVDVTGAINGRFLDPAGMWTHLHWDPGRGNGRIAYLRPVSPLDSQRSSYTLWLMDQDGSNDRQIYPLPGENSHFPRERQFMAWGPAGEEMAFIFDDALHLLNLESEEAFRVTQDDARSSLPTWAPYGRAITGTLPLIESDDRPPRQDTPLDDLLPDE